MVCACPAGRAQRRQTGMNRVYEYGATFYSFLDSFAVRSAGRIVPLVMAALPIASVVDFGCGQGAWLHVWRGAGADILGVDGPYVDRSRLLIPAEAFLPADLASPLDLHRRFDLVQSLEVAEHLPPACADAFIAMLTRHGDAVLFSAAVPGQGGEHHVNEQPLAFWRGLFAARGYRAVDLVRPAVRGDAGVQRWYCCNTVLYVNDAAAARLAPSARDAILPGTQPLPSYWTAAERIRQSFVRTLPLSVVDRLSSIRATLSARRAGAA